MSNVQTMKLDEKIKQTTSEKESFIQLISCVKNIKEQLSLLNKMIKDVEKKCNKKIKSLEKECKKSKNRGNKQPSGFANPTNVSKQLCEFMQKPLDTKMARTDVTKYIIQYIKNNKLEDPKNAKIIKPDTALTSLFDIKNTDEVLTYFNMQRHMNKHFLKIQLNN